MEDESAQREAPMPSRRRDSMEWSLNVAVSATPQRYKAEVVTWHGADLDFADTASFPRTHEGLMECRRWISRALRHIPQSGTRLELF